MYAGTRARFALLLLWSGVLCLSAPAAFAQHRPAKADRVYTLRVLSLLRQRALLSQGERPSSPPTLAPQAAFSSDGAGRIAGTLAGLSDEAIVSAVVMAWTADSTDGQAGVGMGKVGPGGTYLIEGLNAGAYYVIASADGYEPKYYDDATDLSQATPVLVTDTATTRGIDFDLEPIVPGTGSIAGTVRTADGQSGRGASVYAFDPASPFLYGTAETGPDGAYLISGLKTGHYLVEVWAEGYLTEFFDDAATVEAATLVEVHEPERTEGIVFSLSRGGSISGLVRDETGAPVAEAFVQAVDPAPADSATIGADGSVTPPERSSWAITDEAGRYRIGGLASGDYLVYAQSATRWSYAFEWYEEAGAYEAATPVPVLLDEETTGIDFTLSLPSARGSIGGRVNDASGSPVAEAFVQVQQLGSTASDSSWFGGIWAYAMTDKVGAYRVEELPAGRYLVAAAAQGGWTYVERWYPDAETPDQAEPVIVGEEEQVSGIDFRLPVTAGAAGISGVVLAADGAALPGAFVEVQPASTEGNEDPTRPVGLWAYGQADSTGAYQIDRLPAGTYLVHASYGDGDRYGQGWYDGVESPEAATRIVLGEGEQRGSIDFRLNVRTWYGTVEGTVTEEATGAPIPRAYVEVLPLGRDYLLDAPMRYPSAYGVTDETGRYVISYVPEGRYLLAVYADGAFAYYQNATTASAATTLSVAGGSTTSADVALAVRHEGEGVVSGRVTAGAGNWDSDSTGLRGSRPGTDPATGAVGPGITREGAPPEIAIVTAYPISDTPVSGPAYVAVTAPDGTYRLRGMAPGTYVVMSVAPGFVGVYFDNAYDPAAATPVRVTDGAPAEDVDFALSPIYYMTPEGGADDGRAVIVYGTVTGPDGKGVAGATVYLLDGAERPLSFVQTSADGSYELARAAPGRYRLRASKLGLEGRYNGNARRFAEAEAVTLAGGRVEVNLTLGSATPTGIDGEAAPLPQTVTLLGNYPNPFNPETVIRFQLPGETYVTVRIFDVLGRPVATLTDRRYGAGQHEVRWNARDESGQLLSSGVYFYRLEAGSTVQAKSMLLLR